MINKNKYRAWDGTKMWTNEDSGYTPFHDSEGCMPGEIIAVLACNNNWKWMQFTGLKNIHGKELYEGDIIKDTEGTKIIGFVKGCFVAIAPRNYNNGEINMKEYWCEELFPWIRDNNIVLGNIYENSNLLK